VTNPEIRHGRGLACSAIALLLVAAPHVVDAQQTGRVARVGWLGGGTGRPLSEQQELPTSKAFAEGLLPFDYVVGENLLVERRVVAVLGDPRVNELQFRATEAAARTAGVVRQRLAVTNPNEIDRATAQAVHQGANALPTLSSPLVNGSLKRIADAALRHHLPAIRAFVPGFAEAGGLLAYGPDFPDLNRRAPERLASEVR
jgi:hypothetical protein